MTELSSDTTQQILLQLYCREQTEQPLIPRADLDTDIYDSETFLAWRETKRDFVVRDIENRVWVKSCPAGYITEVHFKGDGTLTASPDSAVKQTMEAEEVRVADSFGLWKVQDSNGNTLIGWVFPQILSMDMQPLPLCLFNNGSQHAIQEKIAGEMAGKSVDLPKGNPAGYRHTGYHRTAQATT